MSDDHGHGWRSTCGLGVCGSGSGTMMAWCADVVLLPLAHTHAGPQPCVVTSLNSYKRPRTRPLTTLGPPELTRDHRKYGTWVYVQYLDVHMGQWTSARAGKTFTSPIDLWGVWACSSECLGCSTV